jgi:DNA (cytosine-5)-methyltransferase 1
VTYADVLSDAWKEHLAERADDAPTVASLFAGCGGSSLGYSMAGFRELLAVEWDAHAAETFRRNLPDVPVYHGDITRLDTSTLGTVALDVLDGSPPCQGFSTTKARRSVDDERNDLFREFVRCLEDWRPRVFVMENVSGMVKGPMKSKFVEILKALRAAGYRVEARLVNAASLGVPQSRQRMIFIGVRNDLGIAPRYPSPQATVVTTRDAWRDLGDLGIVLPVDPKYKIAKLCPWIKPGQNGAHTLVAAGRKSSRFNVVRLAYEKPSPTIVKMFSDSGAGYLHPRENRWLSTGELARIQSFPDEYDWGVSEYANKKATVEAYTEIHARIGNSVPPLMMRAIARTVRDILDQADGRDRNG